MALDDRSLRHAASFSRARTYGSGRGERDPMADGADCGSVGRLPAFTGSSIGTRVRYSSYTEPYSEIRVGSSIWMASTMEAVVATAKTSCASVIVGVIQNASRNPKYSG